MKVMTVLGTRPEIIRLSLVIELLDRHCDHVLVHTGQNFSASLSDVFFNELGVRSPDVHLGIGGGTAGRQIGQILEAVEEQLLKHRPDRLLILGDTDSGLAAVVARRLGIPVFHMEAGNRCFDDRVPEEINRRVIDHCSSVLMPYTERSRANLLREGMHSASIFVTGNPIRQVIQHHAARIDASQVLSDLGLTPGAYFLVTMHRAENVDDESRLASLVRGLESLVRRHDRPAIVSVHPRTWKRLQAFDISTADERLQLLEPLGFFDFIRLERDALCLISDSGTVQEEACLLGRPNVTIRDVTERPETVECGSNFLAGADADRIVDAVDLVIRETPRWEPPPEYLRPDVAGTVTRIVLGHRAPDAAELRWQVLTSTQLLGD